MLVLGVNCGLSPAGDDFMPDRFTLYFHDAAAVLLRDGDVVAGVEQERLSRVKHTTGFAGDAIQACLETAGARLADVDRLAFFFDEEYVDGELYQMYAERPRLPLRYSRTLLADRLRERFGTDLPSERVTFVPHHRSHAYSAYGQSGWTDALVVVMDGSGEYDSVSVYDAHGSTVDLLTNEDVPHSLGLAYLAGTQLLGYRLFDEYKVMGLAPHGDPRTYRAVFDSLYELRPGGRYRLDHEALQPAFHRAGFPPRRAGEPLQRRHRDFAAGLQEMVERIGGHVVGHWQRATGHRRLALAGGVGQNSTLNGKLLRGGLFEDVFAHPAAHDAGAALGAALAVATDLPKRRIRHVFWGPALPPAGAVERILDRWSTFIHYGRSGDVAADTARLLAEGKVVGWVQGRSEFGPRALGNRSILADPRPSANRDRVNRMIKQRETYRPFAPSVQAEHLREYFEFPDAVPVPDFMVFTVPVRPDKRDVLGAVTHVDGSARVHAVDRAVNPLFWRLLGGFAAHTGVPVLLNTSFNNHAEPIVDSVADAVRCFLTTGLDHLVVGDLVVGKRPWTAADLGTLAPVLMPATCLAAEHRAGAVRYRIGADRPVTAAAHAALSQADGRTPLHQLTDDPAVVEEVALLWTDRYVDLVPATPPR
jgi:decarbamoylnovobiocin carbamoyltransferase/7-O-carbamoyltransferase